MVEQVVEVIYKIKYVKFCTEKILKTGTTQGILLAVECG